MKRKQTLNGFLLAGICGLVILSGGIAQALEDPWPCPCEDRPNACNYSAEPQAIAASNFDTLYATAGEIFTITPPGDALDTDIVANSGYGPACTDEVYIVRIYWGDGDPEDFNIAQKITLATHEYEKTKCENLLLRMDLDDAADFADDATKAVYGLVQVSSSGDEETGCFSSDMCVGGPGCFQASFPTDPLDGRSPSGLRYSSVGYESVYSTMPFGTGKDENKNWRLMEDGHAGRELDGNVLRLVWGGKSMELFYTYQGLYYSAAGDSTAEYEYQASPPIDRVVVYRPDGTEERYEEVKQSGSHYMITSIVDPASKATTFTYGDPWNMDRLNSVAFPDGRSYTYTYNGNYLVEIEAPSGVKLQPRGNSGIIHTFKYAVGSTVYDQIGFTHSTTAGEEHLIEKFTRKDSSGTEYFRQEVDYVDSDGELEKMREIADGVVIASTVEEPLAGYEAGSYMQILPDGSRKRVLITQKADLDLIVATQRLDSASNVILSSTELRDYRYEVVKSATSVAGATKAWTYAFQIDSATYPEWARNLMKVTNGYGHYKEYRYDTDNQVESVLAVENTASGTETLSWSRSEYDEDGHLTRSYVLDGSDILTDATRSYGSNGKLSKTVDGEGRETHFVYDATTELLTQVGILEATTEYEYDPDTLRKTKVTSPEDRVTEYAYTVTGNLKSVTQYIGATPTPVVTTYSYDKSDYGDQLTEIKDAEGYKTKYAYNAFGHFAAEEIYSGTSSWVLDASATFSYDIMGRLTEKYDFKGQKTRLDYDSIGRLEAKRYMTGAVTDASIEYIYSDDGHLWKIKNWDCGGCGSPESTMEHTYDATSELLISRTSVASGDTFAHDTIDYEYDGAGRRTLLEYPNGWGQTVEEIYSYDLANHVVGVSAELANESSPSTVAEYEYNEASERTRLDYGNNAYVLSEYDDYGRVELLANMSASDATMSSFLYSYDGDGLVESVTLETGDYIEYDYDGLKRLIDEHKRDGDDDSTIWRREYDYDKVGNRTERVRTKLVSGSPVSVTETLQYNGLGQLATMEWEEGGTDYRTLYSYDLNGNLATKQEQSDTGGGYGADTSWTYTWDREDRLTKVLKEDGDFGTDLLTVEYGYCASCGGAMKYRIEKNGSGVVQSWLRYEYEGINLLRIDEVYDDDEDGVIEDPEDGEDDWRVINAYINGPGSISQIVLFQAYSYFPTNKTSTPDASFLYYHHYDRLGNVGVMSDPYGNEATQKEMDAFGNSTDSTSWPPIDSPGWKAHLTGKMYDEDTGLYYFIARWYDPEAGRFVSRDPLALQGITTRCGSRGCAATTSHLICGRKLRNPSLYGAYVFAANNPLLYVDPNGKESKVGKVVAVIKKALKIKDAICCMGCFFALGSAELACGLSFSPTEEYDEWLECTCDIMLDSWLERTMCNQCFGLLGTSTSLELLGSPYDTVEDTIKWLMGCPGF